MAIGLTYPALTATGPRRARVSVAPRITAKGAMRTLAFSDLIALGVAAAVFAPRLSSWSTWVLVLLAWAFLASRGHYELRIAPGVGRELRSLVVGVSAPFVGAALLKLTTTAFSLETATVGAAAVVLLHGVAFRGIRSLRSQGLLEERTLIVGAGQIGVKLSAILREHPEYGMRPVGFLDDVQGDDLPLPLFGGVELLRMVLSEEHIDRVIVAFGVTREAQMLETIRACQDATVDIHVLPRFFELGVAVDGNEVDDIWGMPLVRLRRSLRSRCSRFAKRALDVSVAALALTILAPLYGLIALAVKVTSHGPVYFRQARVGERGVSVEVLKFRTMEVHEGTDEEWTASDERLTSIGGVLRRLGLDEMPQLWSIVRGSMSLVGPRPERPFFVERFRAQVPHYDARHRVPCGLTGLAQVNGLRGDTSIDERARFDNRYIESWSFWRDLVIICQTVLAVFRDARSSSVPQVGTEITFTPHAVEKDRDHIPCGVAGG